MKDLQRPIIPETGQPLATPESGQPHKLEPSALAFPAGQEAPAIPAGVEWPPPAAVPRPYEVPSPEVLLDLCFRELVRYYRHSGCGRLSQGIAHRMNSPLQILAFQLELLEQKAQEERRLLLEISLPAGEKLQTLHHYRQEKLRQFSLEVERLQRLVQNIVLQGAHEEAEDRRLLDLNEIYRRELDFYLAQSFFKHRVEKQFYFQEDLPPVLGHYIDFSQSFRNLLENALEAMAESSRRRLTVATSLEDGRRLLQVGDTGTGIPSEIRPRIFEPFFTTKGDLEHERAGLGLFMARRLLAPYGGEITVASVPGETWVTVSLPVE